MPNEHPMMSREEYARRFPVERLTPDEEVLVNALRSVVGGALSPLGLYHLTGILRIIERLSGDGTPPTDGHDHDYPEHCTACIAYEDRRVARTMSDPTGSEKEGTMEEIQVVSVLSGWTSTDADIEAARKAALLPALRGLVREGGTLVALIDERIEAATGSRP